MLEKTKFWICLVFVLLLSGNVSAARLYAGGVERQEISGSLSRRITLPVHLSYDEPIFGLNFSLTYDKSFFYFTGFNLNIDAFERGDYSTGEWEDKVTSWIKSYDVDEENGKITVAVAGGNSMQVKEFVPVIKIDFGVISLKKFKEENMASSHDASSVDKTFAFTKNGVKFIAHGGHKIIPETFDASFSLNRFTDSDKDGMHDIWEINKNLHPDDPYAENGRGEDGKSNYEKYLRADSDGDGMTDLWEINHGRDPHFSKEVGCEDEEICSDGIDNDCDGSEAVCDGDPDIRPLATIYAVGESISINVTIEYDGIIEKAALFYESDGVVIGSEILSNAGGNNWKADIPAGDANGDTMDAYIVSWDRDGNKTTSSTFIISAADIPTEVPTFNEWGIFLAMLLLVTRFSIKKKKILEYV